MNNQFSENLKKIRKENNLSQEQLAEELGVSRQAISKWESAVAYPEMDKIIALCDKFNLNIDDLLHKDIKEVKMEDESKKSINTFIDNFLKYITDTINLFSNMTFKSKMKCLIEQVILIILLVFASELVCYCANSLFIKLLDFLPGDIELVVVNILEAIAIIFCIISSIMILTHVFKTRYLDYYDDFQKENNNEEMNSDVKEEKDNFIKKEDKVVIRDPKHSEYRFVNGLFKFLILFIKFFALCFVFTGAITLIGLFIAFVVSFLLYKTGIFFIGLLLSILSVSFITIIIILLLLNFIFNRKNDKKKLIWSFIISLVTLGVGCGLVFMGSLSFNIDLNNTFELQNTTKEYDMKDNLVIYPYSSYKTIEYVESDNNNIKIEYSTNKYCSIDDEIYTSENQTILNGWVYCNNPLELIRAFVSNLNEKKIVPITDHIEKITIYTTKENIEILKNNIIIFENQINNYQDEINLYQRTIEELENQNEKLLQKIEDLEEKLDD